MLELKMRHRQLQSDMMLGKCHRILIQRPCFWDDECKILKEYGIDKQIPSFISVSNEGNGLENCPFHSRRPSVRSQATHLLQLRKFFKT